MFFYSWQKLQVDAAQGDLFVCHLAKEAKAVFDPNNQLAQLRAAFKLRASYAREIEQASDLGWFLTRFGRDLDSGVVARRMIWCVRTILIARSAEEGTPVFAPQDLASRTRSRAAQELLTTRHQRKLDAMMRHRFERFLADESFASPWHLEGASTEFIKHFVATSNKVALQTIEQSDHHKQSVYS
jgi:hypothetical protein